MEQNIVSMREIQRNYKKLLEEARKKRAPVFLGAHKTPQAVLIDIDEYRKLKEKSIRAARTRNWKEIEAVLDRIAAQGRQGISLAKFVQHDRQTH